MIKAGNNLSGRFTVSNPATGALANADSLPTGTLIRNGDSTAVSVTITNISTGIYKYSCTIPSNYAAGDFVEIQITGSLGSVSFGGIKARDVIVVDYSPAADEIWTHARRTLTMSAAEIAAIVSGSSLTFHRGDTLDFSITGLGDISTREKLWFTVKDRAGDPADSEAKLMILEYSGTDETSGLVYINGAAAGTPANGSLTVDDAANGDITIVLEAVECAKLVPSSRLVWDVQMLDTNGDVITLTTGSCSVTEDVTRDTN